MTLDLSGTFGAHVRQRLREDVVVWLATVDAAGTPQPNPVWFVWDGESVLVYSLPDAARLAHIAARPRVSLHFDGDRAGGDVVVLAGEARIARDEPPADRVPAFVAKYERYMRERHRWTTAQFASRYSVPVRIRLRRARGHA